jgi:hypothetical protein
VIVHSFAPEILVWVFLKSRLAALGTEVVDLAFVFMLGSSGFLIYLHVTHWILAHFYYLFLAISLGVIQL